MTNVWYSFLSEIELENEERFVMFAPEAKTRQWLYKKEVQNETMKKYYLEYMEYNSAQIEKVAEFLSE